MGKYDNHILKYNRNTGIVDCRKCKEHNKIKDFRNSSKSQINTKYRRKNWFSKMDTSTSIYI